MNKSGIDHENLGSLRSFGIGKRDTRRPSTVALGWEEKKESVFTFENEFGHLHIILMGIYLCNVVWRILFSLHRIHMFENGLSVLWTKSHNNTTTNLMQFSFRKERLAKGLLSEEQESSASNLHNKVLHGNQHLLPIRK